MHEVTAGGGYAVTKDMIWTKASIENVLKTFGESAVLEFTNTGCKINTLPLEDDTVSFMHMKDLMDKLCTTTPVHGPDIALVKSLMQGRASRQVLMSPRALCMYVLRRNIPKDKLVIINDDMLIKLKHTVIRDIFSNVGKLVLLLSVGMLLTACSITPWTPPVPEPTPAPVVICPDTLVTVDYASLPAPVKCESPPPPIKLPPRTIVVSKPCSIPSLIETKHIDNFNFMSYQNDMPGYIKASKLRILELERATKTIRTEYTKCLQ